MSTLFDLSTNIHQYSAACAIDINMGLQLQCALGLSEGRQFDTVIVRSVISAGPLMIMKRN